MNRHKKIESEFRDNLGIDMSTFWDSFLFWEKPTINRSYEYIRTKFRQTSISKIYMMNVKIFGMYEDTVIVIYQ
jgi:hypothetical protein